MYKVFPSDEGLIPRGARCGWLITYRGCSHWLIQRLCMVVTPTHRPPRSTRDFALPGLRKAGLDIQYCSVSAASVDVMMKVSSLEYVEIDSVPTS